MTRLRQIVASNIRRHAKRRGIGLNVLADLAGVSRSQLFLILGGNSSPTIDWLERVAVALEVAPSQLLVEHRPTRRASKSA